MITTSIFQLFKIGPGPSSSHTVGPMRAMDDFRNRIITFLSTQATTIDPQHPLLADNLSIRVQLYGSLAATGLGHGTHRAILAGLMGEKPHTVDAAKMKKYWIIPGEQHNIILGAYEVEFNEDHIIYNYDPHPYRHSNTLKAELVYHHKVILEQVYYSVGGGFIETDTYDEPSQKLEAKQLPYPYNSMDELIAITLNSKLDIAEILYANEMSISNMDKETIDIKLKEIMQVMRESITRGLNSEGILPGGLGVARRAKEMYAKAELMESKHQMGNAMMARLNAYALATSEENADGNMVVTAPTNGAAGIIPACVEYLMRDCFVPEEKIGRGLLVAAMIGYIIKDKASISGAELGCQAEVGSAASMGAALFSYCFDEDIQDIATSAEIALEHHLGMTCDPVKGLVQVPCIERNATGAVKAFNAYLLASDRPGKPIISFDQVVEVMRQTGEDLSNKYKETALGGLASYFGWGNMPGS